MAGQPAGVDRDTTTDVPKQLRRLPPDATHLALRVGGNDALNSLPQIDEPATLVRQGLVTLNRMKAEFESSYRALSMICTEPGDYSVLSPIEPSSQGGAKIARFMVRSVLGHDFTVPGCRIYGNCSASPSVHSISSC